MNLRNVVRHLGLLLMVLSGSILTIAAWSGVEYMRGTLIEPVALRALATSVGIGLAVGLILWRVGKSEDEFLGRREALLLVALSWLFGAALAGLPFWLWALLNTALDPAHPFQSFISCYFEAMSGLTTTGATVLEHIETIPRGLLLWRAMTQWLGGLGIVVLFVAVLPTLGVGGKKLFQVEAPGPTQQGVRPRIRAAARALWLIYLGLTVTEILALRLFGMTWFDSICHTFTTLATGGFSTQDASVGAFPSLGILLTITLFMLLAGVNFGLYYQLIRGRWQAVWTNPELRLYLAIVLIATVIVSASTYAGPFVSTNPELQQAAPESLGQAITHGLFQVISIQSTTGFCTVDFDQWPFIAKATLFALMFVGASAGSTGGGIKVIRCLIAFKVMLAEIERVFRPNVVRTVKVGQATVDPELRLATLVYVIGIISLFLIGTVALMLLEPAGQIDMATAATAAASTLNNIGPGLARIGPIENYGWFSSPSLAVMSLLMVLGRLEVYAIMVMFVPRFWISE